MDERPLGYSGSMELRFRLVDAFTEEPFRGNRLCVVPETPEGLADEVMHTLALEINFAETTFVTSAGPDGYAMRIFTPNTELPFAGHPTIGTAFVLANEGRIPPRTTQTTAMGQTAVEVDLEGGFAWMTQQRPSFRGEFAGREVVAAAAGLAVDDLDPDLPMEVVWTGLPFLLVPVRDEVTLRRAERSDSGSRRALDAVEADGLYLFAIRRDGELVARMFDAGSGIGEDPATGSAVGPLGAYLAARGLARMPGRAVVAQGEQVGRPSFLHVDVRPDGDSWTVRVGGGVRIVGEGVFRLPG
jgi:trans-2,3-dihydro-3-hydroxyanthranilate isomerase